MLDDDDGNGIHIARGPGIDYCEDGAYDELAFYG